MLRPGSVGRVLHHQEAVSLSQVPYPVHITRVAAVMHDHDRTCARSDLGLHIADRNSQIILGGHIGQHGRGARVPDRIETRHKCEVGHNDLVPGTDPQGHQNRVQPHRTVGHGHRELRTHELGEFPFETCGAITHSQPPTAQHLQNGGLLLRTILQLRERYVPGHGSSSALLSSPVRNCSRRIANSSCAHAKSSWRPMSSQYPR